MKKIKAIFEIEENDPNAGVRFKCGRKDTDFNDLTRAEQSKMLNAWLAFYQLYAKFYAP